MLSLNKIKFLKSLNIKKHRQKERKVALEGVRLIDEALKNNLIFEHIWINEKNLTKKNIKFLIEKFNKKKINYTFSKSKEIQSASLTKNPQGIIGLISIDKLFNDNLENFSNKIVVLDEISDPGNLGTILRTCAWFGVNSLILTENSTDIYNSKCLRSGMGGHFYMKNITYKNNSEIIAFLNKKKYNILCATLDGEKISNLKLGTKWALILGSEAHGLSQELAVGTKILIPQYSKIESLNVSIACGILLNDLINNY